MSLFLAAIFLPGWGQATELRAVAPRQAKASFLA